MARGAEVRRPSTPGARLPLAGQALQAGRAPS